MKAFTVLSLLLAATLQQPTLPQMTPEQVSAFLTGLSAPTFGERVAAVARAELGTPYENGPLGEGPDGKYDTDPLMDLQHVDCVTFVEQTIALAASDSYDQAFEGLQQIRYRDGVVDFESRNHFMISDWLENNSWCEPVSGKLGITADQLTRTISRKNFFKLVEAPKVGQNTPDREVTLEYVPVSEAAKAEAALPSPALIVFIGKVDWLFALHTGLYLRDANGKGQLVHASSKAGKVIAMDLGDYLEANAERYLGFAAYHITDPKLQAKTQHNALENMAEAGAANPETESVQ